MKILYLHGWHSVPGGVKPSHLRKHGHCLIEPALPDEDFERSVEVAQHEFGRQPVDLIVGSSRGGAVAMNLSAGAVPLVILCPAWKRWGLARTVKPGTLILHAPADEVIPYQDSLELIHNSNLQASCLIAVGQDHRLADPESLAMLLAMVERCRPAGAETIQPGS